MHYYQFNIGDYSSHTSRLSIYEDIAYRRLLDLYYLSERPLNGCSKDVAREIGMLDSLGDVEYVLNKFFTEKNGAWYNKRCDKDIKAYHNKKKSAKKAGIASGKARKAKSTKAEQTLNGRSTDVELTNNHKPITNNHKPKIKTRASPFVKPLHPEVVLYCNEKNYNVDASSFIAFYESNGWKVGKNPMKSWKAALTTWHKRNEKEANNGSHQQNSKPSLTERATAAREEWERNNQ